MRLSVIFSTYNQPSWLEKVLWGFEAKTFRDFEMLVADDGSSQPTRDLVERRATACLLYTSPRPRDCS